MEINLIMSKNALCPCHSGEKYKSCCMGKLTPEQVKYFAFLNKQKIIKDKLLLWVKLNLSLEEINEYAYSFDKRKLEDYEQEEDRIPFLDWFFFEAKKYGKVFIEHILDDSPDSFDDIEKKIIKEYIDNTTGGIFEVLRVFPNDWKFFLKEVFTSKEYEVIDKIASKNFVKGDIIYSRLQMIFSKYYLSGVGKIIQRNQLSQMKKFVEEKLDNAKKKDPKINYECFMLQFGKDFNEFEPSQPSLVNITGEELCLCEMEYKFDIKKINNILDLFADVQKYLVIDMDYPKLGFKSAEIAVLAKKHKEVEGEDRIMVTNYVMSLDGERFATEGSITIKKDSLKIFSTSKKHAEKIKQNIEKSGYFEFKDESYLSGENAINEAGKVEGPARSKTKKELEAEALFLGSYYKDWCYQKIPALGNITPKQAMKTNGGREKLKKLLLEFENKEEHDKRDGEKFVSAVDIIRKELDFYEN